MAYTCERFKYRLMVEGGFANRDRWVVDAILSYHEPHRTEARRRVQAEARLELMVGISRECRRGRDLGAKQIAVMVEGDREIAGFFEVRDGRSARADLMRPTELPTRDGATTAAGA